MFVLMVSVGGQLAMQGGGAGGGRGRCRVFGAQGTCGQTSGTPPGSGNLWTLCSLGFPDVLREATLFHQSLPESLRATRPTSWQST